MDDGFGQDFCPGVNTETGSAETGDATATASSEAEATGADEGNDAGMYCPSLDVLLTPEVATVHIVVDQSGSMDADFNGPTRWEAIRQTLVGGADSVVGNLESELRFGLTFYTGEEMSCPALQTIDPALNNRLAMTTLFETNNPLGDTPTGEAVAMVADFVRADAWDGPKFIVLATDGEPDSCAVPNPSPDSPEEAAARQAVVDAVSGAFNDGIETFVISVGDEIAAAHLQEVANAGSGEPDATYYQALDQQSLVNAFEDIISGVRECRLGLDAPLTPALAPQCTVTVNDGALDYEGNDGWQLDGDMAIRLVGGACDMIQQGTVSIEMVCPCEEAG